MDSENGGLDPRDHSPLEFAFLAVKDGKIVDELQMSLRFEPLVVTQEALRINRVDLLSKGLTRREDAKAVYYNWMNKNFFTRTIKRPDGSIQNIVDRPSKETMPLFCGHNTAYDRPFLHAMLNSEYDMCYYHRIDTMVLAEMLREMGMLPGIENLKLPTLCKYAKLVESIDEFHGAIYDIRNTYKLYTWIKQMFAGAALATWKENGGVLLGNEGQLPLFGGEAAPAASSAVN